MKRQRRNRSTRRRGLQHVGDVLSILLAEIDPVGDPDTTAASGVENQRVAVPTAAIDSQNTFSFYQTAEV